MNCRSKVELNVCQIVFLTTLCAISVFLAVFGWFRTIEPAGFDTATPPPHKPRQQGNFVAHTRLRPVPYLDEIGLPPLLHHPESYVQWTFLQMNDVYEMIPLSGGKKGGLARVATIRRTLLEENPSTFTIVSGDIVSPSALGTHSEGLLLVRSFCKRVYSAESS